MILKCLTQSRLLESDFILFVLAELLNVSIPYFLLARLTRRSHVTFIYSISSYKYSQGTEAAEVFMQHLISSSINLSDRHVKPSIVFASRHFNIFHSIFSHKDTHWCQENTREAKRLSHTSPQAPIHLFRHLFNLCVQLLLVFAPRHLQIFHNISSHVQRCHESTRGKKVVTC